MITRAELPAGVRELARWACFQGTDCSVRDVLTGEVSFCPRLYGWQIDTRETEFAYGHPILVELKRLGFTHSGRKWNLFDPSEPASINSSEP